MRDTIDMAREAWISETEAEMLRYSEECYLSCTYLSDLKAFEALVRADERSVEREAFSKIQFESILQAIKIEREACATECERMMMYPNARQESAAHQDVWAAAKAIRARGNT